MVYIANERHHHAASVLLARERQRHRGFALAADSAAEQIDLPGEVEAVIAVLMRGVFVGRALLFSAGRQPGAVVSGEIDLRIQERSGDACARAGFLDPRDRGPEIEVGRSFR